MFERAMSHHHFVIKDSMLNMFCCGGDRLEYFDSRIGPRVAELRKVSGVFPQSLTKGTTLFPRLFY
jgi:hypothetical protein